MPSKKARPEQVPVEYRDMMGLTPFMNAMKELKDLSRERGFALLVFATHNLRDDMRDVLKELGIPLLDLWPDISDYMSAHGISQYRDSVMTVGETDPHPSPITHDLIASRLLQTIMNGDPCILNAEILTSRREKLSTPGE